MSGISVVIPSYNRAATLERALRSVYAQTTPPGEVIVVDDASTDNTAEVVKGFEGVRYLRLAENGGAGRARNAGVELANGEWIAFLDSDDTWMPGKLAAQLEFVQQHPDVDLLCTGICVADETHPRGVDHCLPETFGAQVWRMQDFQNYPFSTPTWLIRREAYLAIEGFDASLPNCEDLDFLARFIGRFQIGMMTQPLVQKYNQPDSLDGNLERLEASMRLLLGRHEKLWRESPDALNALWLRLANMRFSAGDFSGGREALRKALKCRPFTFRAWFWLGLSLLGSRAFYFLRNIRSSIRLSTSY